MERHTHMKTLKTLMSAVVILAVVGAQEARAAGIAVDLNSARGTAMAGSMAGFVDDASGIYYNPAGIAQGQGIDVMVGITGIVPFFQTTAANGVLTDGDHALIPPPHIYATYGISDEITVGVGVYTPYGLKISWPASYPGRYIVTSVDLKIFDITPTIAFHFGPVRFAVGAQLGYSTAELDRDINLLTSPPNTYQPNGPAAQLGASAWGFGATAGVMVDVVEKVFQIGAAYRSRVKYNLDGNVHFSNIPQPYQGQLYDQPGSTSVTTPDSVVVGFAYKPLPCLTLDFDVTYFGWQVFPAIVLTYPQTPALNSTELKDWHHTWNYRIGAEYVIDEHWVVRGGIMLDPTPSPAATVQPDVPDSSRVNLAAGFGWRAGAFHIDLGMQWIIFTGVTSGEVSTALPLYNPATYSANALVGTLSFEIKI